MYETQTGGQGVPPAKPPKAPSVAGLLPDDPDTITFEIESDDGVETVTVPLDFSDFTRTEVERVARLATDADADSTASAFLFVATARQAPMDDTEFGVFSKAMSRLWARDPSILKVS